MKTITNRIQAFMRFLVSLFDGDAPVTLHLTKNGFYADPEEIVNHPKFQRQIRELQKLLDGKEKDFTIAVK